MGRNGFRWIFENSRRVFEENATDVGTLKVELNEIKRKKNGGKGVKILIRYIPMY